MNYHILHSSRDFSFGSLQNVIIHSLTPPEELVVVVEVKLVRVRAQP